MHSRFFWAFVFIFLGLQTSHAARTLSPKNQIIIPNDPQWQLAAKRIRSLQAFERWRGIRWLSKQTQSIATKLLLQVLKHPHALTRGWASAALRQRKGKDVAQAMLRALSDRSPMVRLNAVVALQKSGHFSAILSLIQDPSALVREAICKAVAQRGKYGKYLHLLEKCLRERSTMVRIGTAEKLYTVRHLLPHKLKNTVRLVLRLRGRHPRRRRRRRSYNAQWRLRRIHRTMKSYERIFKYNIKRISSWFEAKKHKCFRKHFQAFLGQKEQIQRWETDYVTFTRTGNTKQSQVALSRALLSYRTARMLYRKGLQCRRKYPGFRTRKAYRSYFKKSILFSSDTPAFFAAHQSHIYLRAAAYVTGDTAYDVLRNDIHPSLPPLGSQLTGPFPELYAGASIDFFANIRIGKKWVLSAHNHLTGNLQSFFPQMNGLGNHLKLALMRGERSRRKEFLLFFEENLLYTQHTFDAEGHPAQFAGPRVVQQFKLGVVFRKGRLYRRWDRRKEWSFRIAYRNQLHHPLFQETSPIVWSPHMNHRFQMQINQQFSIFYLGLKGKLMIDHTFAPSARSNIVRPEIWMTLAMGDMYNPLNFMHIEGGVGYGYSSPIGPKGWTLPTPTPAQSKEVAEPIFYVGVFGHFPKLPIQWKLLFWHHFGPPVRPPFSHYFEDRFEGDIRFGVPRELEHILPKRLLLSFGIDVRVLLFGFENESLKKELQNTLADPIKTIRDIAVKIQVSYPIWKGFKVSLKNRLGLLRNTFSPFRTSGKEPSIDTVRNVIQLQLEYVWTGGKNTR